LRLQLTHREELLLSGAVGGITLANMCEGDIHKARWGAHCFKEWLHVPGAVRDRVFDEYIGR
jgi:hypothetical protein